jgi:polar amino acid transport system substrate-binding protein
MTGSTFLARHSRRLDANVSRRAGTIDFAEHDSLVLQRFRLPLSRARLTLLPMNRNNAFVPNDGHGRGKSMGQQKDWHDIWRGMAAAVILLLVFAAACRPGIAHAEATVLQLTTEQLPPLNMSDDDGKTVHGVAADKVHELMRRTGIGYNVQMMSWNRAMELARRQSDTCAFSTVRTSEREASFKWVGPLAKGDWVLFGPKDKIGKVTSLEQIKGARIGGYLGDAAGRFPIATKRRSRIF